MTKPFSDACFDILKSRVLHRAELEALDTEVLKKIIIEKTGREISLHALNRAFGIVPGRFKPSPYTLDVLAMYCDYTNWGNFCIMNS